MTREQRKTIEWQLKNYPARQTEVAERIADVCENGLCSKYAAKQTGRTSVREHSDFTYRLDQIAERRDYRWCLVVENTLKYFADSPIADVARCRYFEYGWERLFVQPVCRKMHICKATLFNYLDTFLSVCHKYAIKYGLMDV